MNIVLWIVQSVLALMFLMAGFMKALTPKDKLATKMPWVNDYPAGMVKFIGLMQLAASLGLILPWLTGIFPVLTPIAAAGLCVIMILAAAYHLRKGERKEIGINLFIFLMAVFVSYGRYKV